MKTFFCVITALLVAGAAGAQPDVKTPHEGDIKTGIITGTLRGGGNTPLAGHIVELNVMRGHDLILTIPKNTDAKGFYQFRNIFQSPEFLYAINTEFEGKVYRTEFVSLKEGEGVRKLDLSVGAGAKEAAPLPPPIPAAGAGEDTADHVHKKSMNEYKLLAVLLSVCVLGYVLWQRRKKS